jgi:hypothetical protein
MGCLLLPFRLFYAIAKIFDWIKEVDDETERIRKAYGMEIARKYKRRRYFGCLIQNLVYIILLVIIGLIVKYFISR